MKYGYKKGFHNVVIKEEEQTQAYAGKMTEEFQNFEMNYLNGLKLPEYFSETQVVANQPEIEINENVRMHDMTLQESFGPVALYSNMFKFLFEFSADSYEKRENMQNYAETVYKNALKLFYVSKEAYNAFAHKEIVYGNSIGINFFNHNKKFVLTLNLIFKCFNQKKYKMIDIKNIIKISNFLTKDTKSNKYLSPQEMSEKRHAKEKDNTVSLQLVSNIYDEDDIDSIINNDDSLSLQAHEQRVSKEYIEAVNENEEKERLVLVALQKIRVVMHKNFGKKSGPRSVFGFTRMGLADNDSLDVVQKRYEYCNAKKGSLSQVADVEVGNDEYDGVPLKLCRMTHTGELIVSSKVNLGDNSPLTQKKIALLQKMNEIIISKRLLEDMEFIGFTTSSQQVLFHPYLEKHKSGNFADPMIRFVKVLKEQSENYETIQGIELLEQTCTQISNQVITTAYLGERKSEWDVNTSNSRFAAFILPNESVRFVFTSERVTTLKEHNIFDEFKTIFKTQFDTEGDNSDWNPDFACSYHNDDYFIGLDLKELYLISFVVPKEQFKKIKFNKAKKQVKKEESVANHDIVKPKVKGKTDINSIFGQKKILL